MADEFLRLSAEVQQEVINAAASKLGLLPAVLEKDVWVCYVLKILYAMPDRRPMVFKGGTSLSKVFNLINRFSEDIDVSIDFLEDYAKPISKTKAGKMRDEIESNLRIYKSDRLLPVLSKEARLYGLTVEAGDTDWEIHVNYNSVLKSIPSYLKARVKIELSGRNEIVPSSRHVVHPYLQEQTTDLLFPEAAVDALSAERTFWEKVTLIHAGLNAGTIQRSLHRLSRHWSDISVIAKTDTGERAIRDEELLLKVVDHKDSFWRDGKAKYDDCRNRKFKLVPTGNTLNLLKADYQAMVESGMFFSERPALFEEIIDDIQRLESRLNGRSV